MKTLKTSASVSGEGFPWVADEYRCCVLTWPFLSAYRNARVGGDTHTHTHTHRERERERESGGETDVFLFLKVHNFHRIEHIN